MPTVQVCRDRQSCQGACVTDEVEDFRVIIERLGAGDGEPALTICRQCADPIHVALVDIVLPAISGPELQDRLNEEFPGIRVVLMTGFAPDAIVSRGINVGSQSGLLRKLFRAAELVSRVQAEVEKLGTASGDL